MSDAERISFFQEHERADKVDAFWRAAERERYHPMIIAFWETSQHLFEKVDVGWWETTSQDLRLAEQSNPQGRLIGEHAQRRAAYDRLQAVNKTVATIFFGELRFYDELLPTSEYLLGDPGMMPDHKFLQIALLHRMVDDVVAVYKRGGIPPEEYTGTAITKFFADTDGLRALRLAYRNNLKIDLKELPEVLVKKLRDPFLQDVD